MLFSVTDVTAALPNNVTVCLLFRAGSPSAARVKGRRRFIFACCLYLSQKYHFDLIFLWKATIDNKRCKTVSRIFSSIFLPHSAQVQTWACIKREQPLSREFYSTKGKADWVSRSLSARKKYFWHLEPEMSCCSDTEGRAKETEKAKKKSSQYYARSVKWHSKQKREKGQYKKAHKMSALPFILLFSFRSPFLLAQHQLVTQPVCPPPPWRPKYVQRKHSFLTRVSAKKRRRKKKKFGASCDVYPPSFGTCLFSLTKMELEIFEPSERAVLLVFTYWKEHFRFF